MRPSSSGQAEIRSTCHRTCLSLRATSQTFPSSTSNVDDSNSWSRFISFECAGIQEIRDYLGYLLTIRGFFSGMEPELSVTSHYTHHPQTLMVKPAGVHSTVAMVLVSKNVVVVQVVVVLAQYASLPSLSSASWPATRVSSDVSSSRFLKVKCQLDFAELVFMSIFPYTNKYLLTSQLCQAGFPEVLEPESQANQGLLFSSSLCRKLQRWSLSRSRLWQLKTSLRLRWRIQKKHEDDEFYKE